MIQRSFVSSTNISEIGYDEPSQTLEVMFTNGSVYQYYNLELNVYEQLMASGSKGQFLNTYIKNLYPFSRVG